MSALDDAREALAKANADLIAAVQRDDGSAQDAMTLVHYAAVEVQRADAAQRQATNDAVVVEWSPPNALHVTGSWSPRAFDSYGLPIPQRVECRCSKCGQTWGTLCGSGLVRAHVQRFALAHLHFEPIGTRLPGSGEA